MTDRKKRKLVTGVMVAIVVGLGLLGVREHYHNKPLYELVELMGVEGTGVQSDGSLVFCSFCEGDCDLKEHKEKVLTHTLEYFKVKTGREPNGQHRIRTHKYVVCVQAWPLLE